MIPSDLVVRQEILTATPGRGDAFDRLIFLSTPKLSVCGNFSVDGTVD